MRRRFEKIIVFSRNYKYFDLYLILLIGFVNAYALMPNLNDSLAITSLEDGPIQPAIVYKNPSNFTNDFHAEEFQHIMWSTITKWLPALSYKYFNIDPIIFHVLYTYSQTVLLLLSVFYLSQAINKSRLSAYLSVFFVIILSPYFNNFSSYGDQFFMPYGTWISMGPLLFLLRSFILNKKIQIFIWAIIGAAIHPTMALCMLIVSFLFLKIKEKTSWSSYLLMAIPIITFLLISAFNSKIATIENPPKQWLESSKLVLHWYSWKLHPSEPYFKTTLYSFLVVVFFFIFSKNSIIEQISNKQTIFKKIIFIYIFSYLMQAVSYSLNIRQIFSISFGRVTIFLAILLVIYSSDIATTLLHEKSTVKKEKLYNSFSFFTLIFPSILLFGFNILFRILILKNRENILKVINPIFIALTFYMNQVIISKSWRPRFDWVDTSKSILEVNNQLIGKMLVNASGYLSIVLISSLIFIIYYNQKYRFIFFLFMIATFAISTIFGRYILSERRALTHLEWRQVQEWAKNNTQTNDKFIVPSGLDIYESWTTLSQRPRLIPDLGAGFLYVYTYADYEFDLRRINLPSWNEAVVNQAKFEKFIIDFKRNFGGSYVVLKKDSIINSFKLVYENNKYIILSLE